MSESVWTQVKALLLHLFFWPCQWPNRKWSKHGFHWYMVCHTLERHGVGIWYFVNIKRCWKLRERQQLGFVMLNGHLAVSGPPYHFPSKLSFLQGFSSSFTSNGTSMSFQSRANHKCFGWVRMFFYIVWCFFC